MIEFPTPIPGDPVRISATLLTTYERCPGEAEGRLRGIYGEDSVASFTGALLHRVIRRHLEDGPIEAESIPHVCRVEIGQGRLNAKMNAVGLGSSSRLEPIFASIGEKYGRFQRYPRDGFQSAEHLIEVEPVDGVTLVGKIDAVFEQEGGGLRLVDWKSGELGSPRTQLGFYALIWTIHSGRMPTEIEVVSLGTGERHAEPVTEAWMDSVAATVSVEYREVDVHRLPARDGDPTVQDDRCLAPIIGRPVVSILSAERRMQRRTGRTDASRRGNGWPGRDRP